MKKSYITYLTALGAAIGISLGATACSSSDTKSADTANQKEASQQANASQNMVTDQPIPSFEYSQLRQNLIELEKAQAAGVQSTTFFYNQGVQDPIFVCPSVGFGVASTTQLSNPEQLVDGGGGNSTWAKITIPQMDPNGVYSGNSTGTYVLCVGGDGKVFAKYWEGFVDTVSGPAKWNSSTHQEEMTGSSSFHFSTGKGK